MKIDKCDGCEGKDIENVYFEVDFEDKTTNFYCPKCIGGMIVDIPEQIKLITKRVGD